MFDHSSDLQLISSELADVRVSAPGKTASCPSRLPLSLLPKKLPSIRSQLQINCNESRQLLSRPRRLERTHACSRRSSSRARSCVMHRRGDGPEKYGRPGPLRSAVNVRSESSCNISPATACHVKLYHLFHEAYVCTRGVHSQMLQVPRATAFAAQR